MGENPVLGAAAQGREGSFPSCYDNHENTYHSGCMCLHPLSPRPVSALAPHIQGPPPSNLLTWSPLIKAWEREGIPIDRCIWSIFC